MMITILDQCEIRLSFRCAGIPFTVLTTELVAALMVAAPGGMGRWNSHGPAELPGSRSDRGT
jgi:hypothetical protein